MKRKSRPGTRFGRRGVAGLREPLDHENKQRFKNSFRLTGGCKADLCPCLRWWRGERLAAAGGGGSGGHGGGDGSGGSNSDDE